MKNTKMEHKGTLTIDGDRIVLRKFSQEDVEATLRNWAGDDKITEFLTWKSHKSIEDTQKVLGDWIVNYDDKSFYQWAIVLKEIDETIGTISSVQIDERVNKVRIGYCLGSKWWGKGYMSETLALIISFFFEEVKVNRVEDSHDPKNANSGKVMIKCGMSHEGTLRQVDKNNQGIADSAVYGILAEEYFDK